jgi:hypothetical protein
MEVSQTLCTAKDLIDVLDLGGFVGRSDAMKCIQAASDVIVREGGNFIPIITTKTFYIDDHKQSDVFYVPALLSITSLKINGETISTDYYRFAPSNPIWENGPYIGIVLIGYSWPCSKDIPIEIEGVWGLYDLTASLGVSATQSTASETTLVVTNGSLLSPGMVLKIENEQEYVLSGAGSPGAPAGTAATSKVNGAIAQGDSTITVDNGAEFHEGEVIQIEVEDIYIQKIGGNVLGVLRGWNGTLDTSHADDSAIRVYRTFGVTRGVNGTTAATHSNKAVSRYVVPDTINHYAISLAARMRMSAETAYSGSSGNSEFGGSKYMVEVPPGQIERILEAFNVGD